MALPLREEEGTEVTAAMLNLNLYTNADLKILAPNTIKEILQDLDTIGQLKSFSLGIANWQFVPKKEHGYCMLNEILEDMKSVEQLGMDKDAWVDRLVLLNKGKFGINREGAETVAKHVCELRVGIHSGAHREFAKLLDQLSQSARGCLVAGLKLNDVSEAWDAAIQERNYAIQESTCKCPHASEVD